MSFETWMSSLPPGRRDIPLNQLAIPGSHNSFSYTLDQSVAPDLDPTIASLVNAMASVLPVVRTTVHNWSKNQHLNITDQLIAGIRYFDCRVGLHAPSGRIRFLHGLWGPNVSEELTLLKNYLLSHPGEIVLLDFNHFYEMGDDEHVFFAAELMSCLGELLIPFSSFSGEGCVQWERLTLSNLANVMPARQIILFYANDTGVALSDLVFWPHNTIEAPWPRTQDAEKLLKFHEEKSQGLKNCKRFYVCQGVCTPDGGMIMKNLSKSFYEHIAGPITQNFTEWIAMKCQTCGNDKTKYCSIFIVDGVERANYIQTVLSLNSD